ncbi:hypothetical protein AAHC03_04548 [Spirometra sp. Aus1]
MQNDRIRQETDISNDGGDWDGFFLLAPTANQAYFKSSPGRPDTLLQSELAIKIDAPPSEPRFHALPAAIGNSVSSLSCGQLGRTTVAGGFEFPRSRPTELDPVTHRQGFKLTDKEVDASSTPRSPPSGLGVRQRYNNSE